MNMKTLVVLVLMGMSFSVIASDLRIKGIRGTKASTILAAVQNLPAAQSEVPSGGVDFKSLSDEEAGATTVSRCKALFSLYNRTPAPITATGTPGPKAKSDDLKNCENLKKLSGGTLVDINPRDFTAKSLDGQITCKMKASYTIDYENCEKAAAHYNFVANAEVAMDLQQKIRTDLKSKSIQEKAAQEAASGNLQEGALNAGIENHQHMKNMNTEKMGAYSLAVAALVRAYTIIPGEKKAMELCKKPNDESSAMCPQTIKDKKPDILANQEAKAALGLAIAKFTAKGLAAGIAMGQNLNAVKKIEQAKNQFDDGGGEDVMMERCTFNPTDPACLKPGSRVQGQSFTGGEFGMEGGGNNSFDMTGGVSEDVVEVGAETDLGSDGVAGLNSPFAEEAKNANKILDPAGAAQMQASGGASGGGAGGGGGGGGGGGASLGSDLSGADKDGDKEVSIKTNKVSGTYGAGGGGGFKGIGKGKEEANPFASLFDAKSEGGIEEDRSIASGDIDGAASGLFQKISNRYNQIQADKRIEAKNLE